MMADPFYSGNVQYTSGNTQYTSGSNIFQTGANNFSTGNLEYGNYDGNNDSQAGFGSGVIYGRNGSSTVRAPAATSSTTDFQVAATNAANSTTNDFENTGDAVSEAHSSPAHFIDYNEYMPQETEDNKENREWYGGYAY